MPQNKETKARLISLRLGATDTNAVKSYYDEMADHYDDTLAAWQYRAPKDACDLLTPHLADGARILDVGCGTGLMGRALLGRGAFRVDGIDISDASLRLAERRCCYARLIRHDLQALPLPVERDSYDAAAAVGVMSYIADAPALMRDLCRAVRPGGLITFTQRTDFWQERDFAGMIDRLEGEGIWTPVTVTRPLDYIPGHADFTDEIRVIHSLCRVI
jgi:predicted TPR repeat methyltransferase